MYKHVTSCTLDTMFRTVVIGGLSRTKSAAMVILQLSVGPMWFEYEDLHKGTRAGDSEVCLGMK
jgi:hypothetical protein